MKNYLIALLLVASGAQASSYDLYIDQMNLSETDIFNREIKVPTGNRDGILFYKDSTKLPQMITIGSGLALVSDELTATAASQVNADWTAVSGMAQILNKPTLFSGAYADLTGKPSLFDGAYTSLTSIPSNFAPSAHTHAASDVNSGTFADARIPSISISKTTGLQAALDAKGVGSVTSIGVTSSNLTVSGSPVTSSGNIAISLPSVGTAGTYTVVSTDAQGRVTAGTAASQSAQTRTLNSAFQISATRASLVNYSVRIVTTASIGGNQDGEVVLEIASDSGFTANVQTLSITQNAQALTLAITLNSVQTQTGVLSGYVPAGYYARLRTVNNTGTPTYLYRAGQEILM